MDNLKKEYTDIKNMKHHVEHITANDKNSKEQIIEELCYILTKPNKRISA